MPIDLDSGSLNDLQSRLDRLQSAASPPVPQARVFNSAALTITTATDTALTFNSERWDNGSLHSTSATTGRLTAPITGLYGFGAAVRFAANATGDRTVYFRINGSTIVGVDDRRAPATRACSFVISGEYQLTAGDYVEVVVRQDSGGNLNVVAEANYSPEFWMSRRAGFVNVGV